MPVKEKNKKQNKCSTYIGGQAVLEGVMMMGKTCMATAVRDPDGEIQVEAKRLNKSKAAVTAGKIPFVRGVVNLFSSLVRGMKTLMRSAAVYGDSDEEEGKVGKWLNDKFGVTAMDVVTVLSVFLGVLLALAIFVFLPNYVVGLFCKWWPAAFVDHSLAGLWVGLILGALKLIIFIGYLALILLMKDIRRLYMYHGAEHKTINAYEHGVELTPEKVRECSRLHDRCGTSFLFIVLLINVIIFSAVGWACHIDKNTIPNGFLYVLARIGMEIVLLPVIAGISYEILKLLAKFDNKFVRILKAPGLLLQKKLTTREPDDQMLEVAIAAFNKVLEMDADETVPETRFITGGNLSAMLEETKKIFAAEGIDESDAEWIYSIVLNVKRSDLNANRTVKPSESKAINAIVKKRLTGRPLWYIIGDTEFFGCKIKVDERALIPRPETELLAEITAKSVEDGDRILDLCTGTGCIAISVANACKGRGVSVTAADISDAAIMLARENANYNSADVSFVVSDMFDNVHGRYNLIVCNPPYIKSGDIPNIQKEVREFEPRIALDGGADGLDFYRRLAKEVKYYLAKDGMLILECGEGQATEIMQLFTKREYAIVLKDLSGVERFLKIAF